MKLVYFLVAGLLIFSILGCSSKSAYNEAMRKDAVKTRSENSARQGMMELDKETR